MGTTRQVSIVGVALLAVLGWPGGAPAQTCDTAPSSVPHTLCPKSADVSTWWHQAGITIQNPPGSWQTQPIFFPPDVAYPRIPLPVGDEKYAALQGRRIKGYVNEITAISRKSRDDGNQYWGRLTGSPYDHQTTEWVAAQLRRVGVQGVRLQKFDIPPKWWPTSWQVSVTGGGKTIPLTSAFPHDGAESANVDLDAVWVGLGTAADLEGRDVRGKAVLIYAIPTPGGQNYSAGWSGAVERARTAGAGAVFIVLGYPGNHMNHGGGAPKSSALTFSLGVDDGMAVREMIERKQSPKVHVRLAVETRPNLHTFSVWGVLPGATDENILIMAHTEAPFQGALDNASGIGTMIELAQYYAALPREQRRRTITFLTTSCHHTPCPDAGIDWVRTNMVPFFDKTALIVNAEHTASMQHEFIGPNLVGSTAIAPRRWYMQGSDELKALITKTFHDYGITVYSRPAIGSGGELSPLRGLAPGFHVLSDIFYHTTLDIPEYVPEAGLESAVRAYAKIIDEVNRMDLARLRSNLGATTLF
jgi:hypothetical protein